MKERFLKDTLLIFFVAGIFSSCKKNEDENTPAIEDTDSVAMIFPVQGMYIGLSCGHGSTDHTYSSPYEFYSTQSPFGIARVDTFYVDSLSPVQFQISSRLSRAFVVDIIRDSIFSASFDTSGIGLPDFMEGYYISGNVSISSDSLFYHYNHDYSWSISSQYISGGGFEDYIFKGAHQ